MLGIERNLTRYEKQITPAAHCCYFAVKPCDVFTTRQLLLATKNDVLSTFQHNIISNTCVIAIVGL